MVIGKTYLSSTISVCVLLAALVIVGSLSATKTKDEDTQSVSPTALSMLSAPPGDQELFSGEALSDCCFNFFALLLRPMIGKGPEDINEECKNKIK